MAIDTALVTYDSEIEKNRELIRKTIAPHLKTDEFELFMAVCKEVRLNPIIKQIYPLATWDSQTNSNKLSIQTSIDGLRLLAERSGDYAGQIGPEWCGKDGQWRDVWLEDAPPMAARVGVLRKSFMQPLFSVAKFKTYAKRKKNGDLMYMWESMPDHMLAKCAESLALRRAFPHETCGLYTREEMAQATIEDSDVIEGHVTASEVVETAKSEKPATTSAVPTRTQPRPAPSAKTEQAKATNESEFNPVGSVDQALTRMYETCAKFAGGVDEGSKVFLRIRKHVIGDKRDVDLANEDLTALWNQIRNAETRAKQPAKAS